jgi:hypothetical protein
MADNTSLAVASPRPTPPAPTRRTLPAKPADFCEDEDAHPCASRRAAEQAGLLSPFLTPFPTTSAPELVGDPPPHHVAVLPAANRDVRTASQFHSLLLEHRDQTPKPVLNSFTSSRADGLVAGDEQPFLQSLGAGVLEHHFVGEDDSVAGRMAQREYSERVEVGPEVLPEWNGA